MRNQRDEFEDTVLKALWGWNLAISPADLTRLRTHFAAVVDANRTMNLTRIIDPVQAAIKHYVDSLAVVLWVRERCVDVKSVLDVGTGAGFPAIPLAVMRPEWSVTAIDATAKKVRFVERAAEAIELGNLHAAHAHSAHWRTGESFDLIVSRALARLPEYLAQAARFAAPSGWIVAYKTADVPQAEADSAVARLDGLRLSREPRYPYDLELEGETLRRTLYVYRRHG